MNWRLGFLIIGPLAFAYYLHQAGNAARAVDLDMFTAFVNLLIALPIGLFTAAVYASAIGEWFGGAIWSRFSEDPDPDHPHWLVSFTGRLENNKRHFMLRWLCFLATQLTTYTGWAVLYRRGMGAAKPNTWMERYFATNLYPLPNAFDAMKAAEALRRNGIEPKSHPDPQVALFIMRAELPDRQAKTPPPSILPGELEPVVEEEKPRRKKKSQPGLMRNRAIALFEGAEPAGPIWKTHGRDAKDLVGSPYEDRRATTVLFAAPSPPPIPFKPVRLPNQRRDR